MSEWEPIPHETPILNPGKLRRSLRGAIINRFQLNVVEFENIAKAFDELLGGKPTPLSAPFTAKWALKVHERMFGEVWTYAGKLRTIELDGDWSPLWRVQTDFHNLFADVHYWQESDMAIMEQAATLHYRGVKVHPFENGNGRWARMIANIWLKLHGESIASWPDAEISVESSIRQEYIAALKEADQHNTGPLIALHERYAAGGDSTG